MTGSASLLTLMVVLGGGAAVVLMVLTLGHVVQRFRSQRRAFVCPNSDQRVEADLLKNTLTKEWVRVETCSAFSPPGNVKCQGACLDDLNVGDVPTHRLVRHHA